MIELHGSRRSIAVGPVKVPALSDVSFRVAKGEFVILAGPSGAGKTTLLRLLYREERADRGRDRGAGRALDRSPPLGGRRAAPLHRHRLPGRQAPARPDRLREHRVRAARARARRGGRSPRGPSTRCARSGLSARAQAYPAQLSQGEAQRAALARAIVRKPALLIADEPTGEPRRGDGRRGPRPSSRTSGRGGTTVILATHQARLAAALRRRTLAPGGRPPRQGRG